MRRLLAVLVSLVVGALVAPQPPAGAASTLNGHPIAVDSSGRIIPWTSDPQRGFGEVVSLAWDYLQRRVPTDPGTGKPAYFSQSYLNPDTQGMAGWPHNPAGLYAMLVESALGYYAYSGDFGPVSVAESVARWQIEHGLTAANAAWASVPYASGDAGSLTYGGASYGNTSGVGDGQGYIEPDKVGQLGYAWMQLFDQTGDARYRDAAIAAANALAGHVRSGTSTQSPWPFRVQAATGAVREDYCANVIDPIRLFDALLTNGLGDTAAYQRARTMAWSWLMTYPMTNNVWANYFEDVPVQGDLSNVTQMNALMTARYLLDHSEADPNWEGHVRGIIDWVERTFGETAYGAEVIREQMAFPHVMGSHTSRYASVNALLYAKTGDLVAKDKAYYSLNWATYMARSDGVVIDGPTVNNQWFTDGYGDYVRHFMTALRAVPEWSPAGETHLTGSTSQVVSIAYGTADVSYSTKPGSGTESLRLAFQPGQVTVGGVALQQRTDLTQEGWTYDQASGVLRVRRDSPGDVRVSGSGSGGANALPTVTLTTPATGTTAAVGQSVSLAATAGDTDGSVARVTFYVDSTVVGADTSAPYTATWTPSAAGTYGVWATATDNQGATATSAVATIVVGSGSPPSGGLPVPWQSSDVGPVGVKGSASYTNGSFTLQGSGVDIWDNADSFRFVYQPMTADGQIVARVASVENSDEWAVGGVMIRADLSPGSPHVTASLTARHGVAETFRTRAGGWSDYVFGGDAAAGVWLRLVRSGDLVIASRSADGTAWTEFARTSIPLGSSPFVGLAMTSHVNTYLATDSFDHVNVTVTPSQIDPAPDTSPPTLTNLQLGSVGQNGATVTWSTDEPADSQVEYGSSSSYGMATARNTTLSSTHTVVISGLDASATYHFRAVSRDGSGNVGYSADQTFTTPDPVDGTAPSQPAGLTATVIGGPAVSLTWQPSTDDVGVTSYTVLRDGVEWGRVTDSAFVDADVAQGSTYSYAVIAWDAAGNPSAPSQPVSVSIAPSSSGTPVLDTVVSSQPGWARWAVQTAPLTTSGPDELLVAFVAADGPLGTQAVRTVSGGGLAWQLQRRENTQYGTAEIWTAVASAPLSRVTVRAELSASPYQALITTAAFKDARLGAVSGAGGAGSHPETTVVSTGSGSMVWGVGCDWDGAIHIVPGSGQELVTEYLASAPATFWVQRLQGTTSASGDAVRLWDEAPTTHRWNFASVEIAGR